MVSRNSPCFARSQFSAAEGETKENVCFDSSVPADARHEGSVRGTPLRMSRSLGSASARTSALIPSAKMGVENDTTLRQATLGASPLHSRSILPCCTALNRSVADTGTHCTFNPLFPSSSLMALATSVHIATAYPAAAPALSW